MCIIFSPTIFLHEVQNTHFCEDTPAVGNGACLWGKAGERWLERSLHPPV